MPTVTPRQMSLDLFKQFNIYAHVFKAFNAGIIFITFIAMVYTLNLACFIVCFIPFISTKALKNVPFQNIHKILFYLRMIGTLKN